jgi:hypothetical protein
LNFKTPYNNLLLFKNSQNTFYKSIDTCLNFTL